MPPPPQVFGEVQLPQASTVPQPSSSEPQSLACAAQVVGVQATQVLEMHTCGETQVPQSIASPQPSLIAPQFLPAATQVVGVQLHDGPHTSVAQPLLML